MDSHDAQELIDKRISAHESAIRDLRTLRNIHAGISKLPIEVLTEIFLLAKLPPGVLYRERRENRGWLNVAGVCRNWREITLNAPCMWDTLDTSKLNTLDWAKTLIARSKNVPLHISCTYPHHKTPRAVLDLVFSHMAKIQDLEITLDTSFDVKIQDILDFRRASCGLQSLALYKQDPLFSDDNGGIDRFLSEVQMPRLLTLDVRFFEIPHTISMLPQLRHLCYMPPMGASRTTVSGMLSFLRSTPALERLEILGPLRPSNNGGKEMARVELAKLSFLSYTTPDFGEASLFRFLHYPPSSRVKFLSRMPPSDTAACANDLVSILTQHVASSDVAAAIGEVALAAIDGDYFDMRVSGDDGPMLDIHFPVVEGELSPLFQLPAMLPCSGARTLRIRGFHSVQVTEWASFFTRHVQVQDLTAEEVDSNFLRALLKPSGNEPPPFTRLQSLLLCYCDIEEHATLVKRILEEHSHLEARVGVTIKIERCRVAGASIRELEAYAKVEWDDIEDFVVDSDKECEDDEVDEDDDEASILAKQVLFLCYQRRTS